MQIKWQFKYYICWDLQSGVLIGDSEWRAEWLWKKKHNADVGGYYYYQAESSTSSFMDKPSNDSPPMAASNLEGIPPFARRAIKKSLTVPTEVYSTLLPHERLSLYELTIFGAKFDIFTHFEAQFGWCSIVVMTDDKTPGSSVQRVIWRMTEHKVVIVQ